MIQERQPKLATQSTPQMGQERHLGKMREHVMAAYRSSLQLYARLYKKLGE